MTQLPNPFLNSTAIPEPPAVGDPAVALSRTSVLDAQTGAAAEAFAVLQGRAVRTARVAHNHEVVGSNPTPATKSALASAMTADTVAGPEFADPLVPAAVIFSEPPSNEGRSEGTPASAPTKNPDVGVLEEPMTLTLAPPPNLHLPDATDHIHEIFHWVRKLMRGHQGFVLDEAEFMADVEEEPLFIRDGAHLRRWEA